MLTLALGEHLLSKAVEQGLFQRRHGSLRDAATASLPVDLPVTSPLSGPAIDPISGAEGTVFFLLQPDLERWRAPGVACNFSPYRAGRLAVETTKTSWDMGYTLWRFSEVATEEVTAVQAAYETQSSHGKGKTKR
jgi:hypothetical protein